MPPPMTSTSTEAGSRDVSTGAGRRQNGVPLPAVGWVLAGLGVLAFITLEFVHRGWRPFESDFRAFYATALIGRSQGWSQIYDTALQFRLADRIGAGHDWPYLNPPLLAWLVAPFTYLPYRVAYYAWAGAMLAVLGLALALVRPGTRLPWYAAAALLCFPVLFGFELGQPVALVALGLVLAWRLDRAGRPWLAGMALALTFVKPHTVALLPLCLLVAGRWRVAAGAVIAGVGFAVVTAAGLGPEGLRGWYAAVAGVERSVPPPHFTLVLLFGKQAGYWAEAAVALAAVTAAYRARQAGMARIIAIAVVGSLLAMPYANLQDLALLVVAGWMLWPETATAERALLGLGWLATAIAMGTGVPVVVVAAGWLGAALLSGSAVPQARRSPAPR